MKSFEIKDFEELNSKLPEWTINLKSFEILIPTEFKDIDDLWTINLKSFEMLITLNLVFSYKYEL